MKTYSWGGSRTDLSSFGGAEDGKTEADVGAVGIVESNSANTTVK